MILFLKVLSVAEVKALVFEQKNACTNLIGDRIKNPIKESPVF
jgi:hypothetical protein